MLTISKAAESDYRRIKDFYDALIDELDGSEFSPGWKKDVYPSEEMLRGALARGELFCGTVHEKIAAAMIVNHSYNEGYEGISWAVSAAAGEILVIHALGVAPALSGRGLAKEMVRFVITQARAAGLRAVRLDVLEGNVPAERAYTALGFVYRGTLPMFYEDTGITNYEMYELVL